MDILIYYLEYFGRVLLAMFIALSVVIVLPLAVLYAIIAVTACQTETPKTIENISDLDFEITIIQCDTAYANLFVSKRGTSLKTLIFTYDAIFDTVNQQYVTPKVAVSDNDIFISVDQIYSVSFQEKRWMNYNIRYNIGDIRYP